MVRRSDGISTAIPMTAIAFMSTDSEQYPANANRDETDFVISFLTLLTPSNQTGTASPLNLLEFPLSSPRENSSERTIERMMETGKNHQNPSMPATMDAERERNPSRLFISMFARERRGRPLGMIHCASTSVRHRRF